MLDSTLPAAPALVTPAKDEVLFVANADLRESATLDGVELMAGDVLRAFVAQARRRVSASRSPATPRLCFSRTGAAR